jgi:hypothetical protein
MEVRDKGQVQDLLKIKESGCDILLFGGMWTL